MTLTDSRRAFTAIEGVHIHWWEIGRGRPLLLLHGLTDSHRTWLPVAPLLAASHRVILPDLAGHGLSDRPEATYTLEWHARIVSGLVRSLELENPDVVGHSYGGAVALTLLLGHQPDVRRLALVAAGGFGREVSLALRLASLPGVVENLGQPFMSIGTSLALNAAGGAYLGDEVVHLAAMNSLPGTARAFARSVRDVIDWRGQQRSVSRRLHEFRQTPPVALFWGDRDPVLPFAHATHAASLFDGAMLHRFPGCGHFPHRQAPEAFASALEAFLDAPLASQRLLSPPGRSNLMDSFVPLAQAAALG
jgi:pimeloyl-ACP methyl ester carboxylesterase